MDFKKNWSFLAAGFGIPLSILGNVFHWSQVPMFVIYCLTIVALAGIMGRATESLAIVSGPRMGGLLNATFGNAVELIISIFALKAGMVGVVLASLTGSVLGNLLLVGGLAFFCGGLKYKRLSFNKYDARHSSVLLIFAVVVAFVIPEVFSMNLEPAETMKLSVGTSVIMIGLYLAMLFFKLVTHRGAYQHHSDETEEHEEAEWSKGKSIGILAAATLAVAYVSEALVHTFHTVGEAFGWSELFIGVIIVAIVGNAAEHASAIVMAYKNKTNIAVEIAVGSTLQIAMFVAPVLVLISLFFTKQMPLVFTPVELVSMLAAVGLTVSITNDGDTNWMEGLALLASYAVMAIGFYFI